MVRLLWWLLLGPARQGTPGQGLAMGWVLPGDPPPQHLAGQAERGPQALVLQGGGEQEPPGSFPQRQAFLSPVSSSPEAGTAGSWKHLKAAKHVALDDGLQTVVRSFSYLVLDLAPKSEAKSYGRRLSNFPSKQVFTRHF